MEKGAGKNLDARERGIYRMETGDLIYEKVMEDSGDIRKCSV